MVDNVRPITPEEWHKLAASKGCHRYNHAGWSELYINGRPVAMSRYVGSKTCFYAYDDEIADSDPVHAED